MTNDEFRDFADALDLPVELDAPFGSLTTYRVGGNASAMVEVCDVESLRRVTGAASRRGLGFVVLGRGSNLLVADEGYRGVVVRLTGDHEVVEIDPEDRSVTAGAAAMLPIVARRSAAAGLSGFEWAVGVPGTIGGAVRMNAGGHGSDMAASVEAADVLDARSGSVTRRDREALGFEFRSSALGAGDVVVRVVLRLHPCDAVVAELRIDDIVRWRRENQPGGQNAGSVFVNPVPGEVAAGRLVDEAGLRGFRLGSAEVSTKHANFIQADEGGRAADVLAVMRHVREVVRRTSGFDLRSEIRLIGFSDPDGTGVAS